MAQKPGAVMRRIKKVYELTNGTGANAVAVLDCGDGNKHAKVGYMSRFLTTKETECETCTVAAQAKASGPTIEVKDTSHDKGSRPSPELAAIEALTQQVSSLASTVGALGTRLVNLEGAVLAPEPPKVEVAPAQPS